MKYLLDTHVFIWWITDSPKLPLNIRQIMSNPAHELYFSAASLWEMMIKSKLNKIKLPEKPKEFIKEQLSINAIKVLNVALEHSFEVYELPDIHKDPFDRMLIAQSNIENIPLITADGFIKQYDVETYW